MAKYSTAGLNTVRDRLRGQYTQMAIGTGTTTPTEADVALAAETLRLASSQENGGNGEVVNVMRINSSQGNGTTITEAADIAAGVLQDRHTFAGIVKTSAIQVEFRLKTKFQNV